MDERRVQDKPPPRPDSLILFRFPGLRQKKTAVFDAEAGIKGWDGQRGRLTGATEGGVAPRGVENPYNGPEIRSASSCRSADSSRFPASSFTSSACRWASAKYSPLLPKSFATSSARANAS